MGERVTLSVDEHTEQFVVFERAGGHDLVLVGSRAMRAAPNGDALQQIVPLRAESVARLIVAWQERQARGQVRVVAAQMCPGCQRVTVQRRMGLVWMCDECKTGWQP